MIIKGQYHEIFLKLFLAVVSFKSQILKYYHRIIPIIIFQLLRQIKGFFVSNIEYILGANLVPIFSYKTRMDNIN